MKGSGAFRKPVKVNREGAGGIGSENADMSSDKQGEMTCRRKSKGSCAKLICAGLAGPKVRPKGVTDGNHVNIPGPGGCVTNAGVVLILMDCPGQPRCSRK